MFLETGRVDHSAAHRTTQSDLLVTRLNRRSGEEWTAELSLPRSHWLCHPVPDVVPLTLAVEALRQAGLAVCIAGFHMDPTVHFVISSLSVRTDRRQLSFPRFGAFEGTATVSFDDIKTRKGRPFRLQVGYAVGSAVTARIDAQVLSDADYRAVRRNAKTIGEAVVDTSHDVLIDPSRRGDTVTATLGVNEADPFFFDHPVDHLPGMLLLHAVAALHTHSTGEPATALDVTFPAFAELRTPTDLRMRVDASKSNTTITQGQRVVADAAVQSVSDTNRACVHV